MERAHRFASAIGRVFQKTVSPLPLLERALAAKLNIMSASMKVCKRHKGIPIYAAAITHPGSKTTSLAIFTEDFCSVAEYNGKMEIKRFRYKRMNGESFTEALLKAIAYINKQVGQLNHFVICDCGGTKYYAASIVHARCANCRKPVWPIHPITKKPLLSQKVGQPG